MRNSERITYQFLDLGVTEYYEAGGVCLIEWADRVESALPEERLTIRIEIVDENRRSIRLNAVGDRYAGIVEGLTSSNHEPKVQFKMEDLES